MSFVRPFCGTVSLAAPAVAAFVLLAPALMPVAHAQALRQAALAIGAKSDSVRASASQTVGTGNATAADQTSSQQPKSLTAKAIEKVNEVAKSAGDIFSRVPC